MILARLTGLTFSKEVILASLIILSACGGGSNDNPTTPTPTPTPDTTAPVITLNGQASVNHEQGTTYVDAGATATDNIDGSVKVTTSGSVGTQAGSYTLTYRAVDAAGNSATEKTRTVIVADTIAPVITLNGQTSVNHEQGTTYVDAGATATDNIDGSVKVTTSGSVGDEVGSYTLTYRAVDAVGNSAEKTRVVTIFNNNIDVFSDGSIGSIWSKGINAFDQAIGFGECSNDNGAGCPSIAWDIVTDSERGDVLQVTHGSSGDLAGLFIASNGVIDISNHTDGKLVFDINVISGDSKITMKLDCVYPCTSGDQALGSKGASGWETVEIPLTTLVSGGLDLTKVNTGIVIWATDSTNTVFQLDNVHFVGINDGGTTTPSDSVVAYGAGSVANAINPDSYLCVFDHGNWIFNAGVVEPAIAGCDTSGGSPGTPSGTPISLHPQLTGVAATKPTPTHKWWGSLSFMGEMTIGNADDAAYVTADPITARVTEKGVRMMGIPSGLAPSSDGFLYAIPDPFSEVFDGIAIANSLHNNLEAYVKDHSDGSVTVEWQANSAAIMQATFVHGSPYVYFQVFDGDLLIRTLRADGGEKGTFYNQSNSLGIWTNVSGNHNNFMVTGEGATTFENITSNEIKVVNSAKAYTITYLPQISGVPSNTMASFFAEKARNVVSSVTINYSVDRSNNSVTISHQYLDDQGNVVDTIVGMFPMHWKNASQTVSSYQVRSARGNIKFAQTSQFSYRLPFVGVLPLLPTINGTFDQATLTSLVDDFINQGQSAWNANSDGQAYTDAYWSGKSYSKVAELIAIADATGLTSQANTLRTWLKSELADWFTAGTGDNIDVNKYFVYDDEWDTLLAFEESFSSHQQLNDHHFHYGYLVRAAAEICRVEKSWCGADQYGPMIELLIRDYAGGRDDTMFPYLRNFDPANGFSWASGKVNFVRGNNNESTSEAANAYGAIILYGLITGKNDLVERGMYLHASTTAAYWEYWNNIGGYNNRGATEDNFPNGYNQITTSIIWGDGAVFSTWFSDKYAHILGIQGLPANPLTLHVGLYHDYMEDYVTLGLTESSNDKPSGLVADQWRDIWWNLWALNDADAAIADYNSVSSYTPEAGETKAHTYHWINTFRNLGQLKTGLGEITADHPAAMVFEKNGIKQYVVYNFTDAAVTVNFSNGKVVTASANAFTVVSD